MSATSLEKKMVGDDEVILWLLEWHLEERCGIPCFVDFRFYGCEKMEKTLSIRFNIYKDSPIELLAKKRRFVSSVIEST